MSEEKLPEIRVVQVPWGSTADTDFSSGTPTVRLPKGASTSLRLHEFFHAKYAPDVERRTSTKQNWWPGATWEDWSLEELGAEEFSHQKRGHKQLSGNSILNVARRLVVEEKQKPSKAMKTIIDALKKLGYSMDASERHIIWEEIQDTYREYKQGEQYKR